MSEFVGGDPNAAFLPPVPAAVRRAAKASENLSRRLAAGEDVTQHAQPPDGREMPAMQPVWTPAPERAPDPSPPAPEPAALAPPVVAAPAQVPVVPGEWEQRYRSLQGRFDAQVPELVQRARTAETQLDLAQRRNADLVRQIEQMQAQARAAPPANPPADDADTTAWGADFVAATRRQARAEISGELAQLRTQVEQLTARPAQQPHTPQQFDINDHQARTNAAISQMYGNDTWHNINGEPGFISWLQNLDDFSGSRRHDLLTKAYEQGDARRVVAFFKAYQAEHTVLAPLQTSPAATPPGAGRVNLADLAAPGGNPGGSSAPTEDAPVTQKDIAQHYQRLTQGYYRNNPKLQAEVGARIDRAVTAGRVQ